MSLTIAQIRHNTSKARELMARARKEHFAVGAFNIDNQETLLAVCRAAQATKSPVLVEVSHSEVKALGYENIRDMVDNYKQEFAIEIYINLDHSPTVDAAKRGVDAGFEFIHIDISQSNPEASLESIVAGTREVVRYATFTGALVESEPHYFAGSSNKHEEKIDYEEIAKTFTKPDEAITFVGATGIDTYAVAVGNLHGSYPAPKKLDLELLGEIRKAVGCNLSLHGGSGTAGHYFEDAARIGVSKVNINTDLRMAFRTTLEKQLKSNPDEFAVIKLMPEVYKAVQDVVENKIEMFGSSGKARL